MIFRRIILASATLLCIACCICWIRSIHTTDEISLLTRADTYYVVATHPHGMDMGFGTHFRLHPPTWNPVSPDAPAEGWAYGHHPWGIVIAEPTEPNPAPGEVVGTATEYEWQPPDKSFLGIGYDSSAQSWATSNGMPITQRSGTLTLPFWLPICVLSLPMLLSVRRTMLRRRCLRTNRCISCGYDLRASPGACP